MFKKSGGRQTLKGGGRHPHRGERRYNKGAEGNRKLKRPCGPPAFLQHPRTCPIPREKKLEVKCRDYRDPRRRGREQNLQSTEETETSKESTESGEQQNPEEPTGTKVQDGPTPNSGPGEGPRATLPNETSVPRIPHRELRRPGIGPGGQRQQRRRAPLATTKGEKVPRNPHRPRSQKNPSQSGQGKHRNQDPQTSRPEEESDSGSLGPILRSTLQRGNQGQSNK